MYLGRIVELRESEALFADPLHPYTQALLSAVATVAPADGRRRIELGGEVPSASDPPGGCPFHPRCQHPDKDQECIQQRPELQPAGGPGLVACHKAGQ